MVSMSMFEAATILIELSNSECNRDYLKNLTRKRRNDDTERDFFVIPKRPRSPRVKKMKSIAADASPMRDVIVVPKRPRSPRMEIMQLTAATAPPVRDVTVRKRKTKKMDLTATPEMSAAMRERILEMGGYEMELVIQKQLHDTDLNKNHGRLSLPIKKLRFDFATEEETEVLNQHVDKNNKMGINVMIIDPFLQETVICLKKWKIGNGDVYCLMTHWNSFVQQNCLKSGQVVQLWSFRKDGIDVANQTENFHHLCFAIAKPDTSQFVSKVLN